MIVIQGRDTTAKKRKKTNATDQAIQHTSSLMDNARALTDRIHVWFPWVAAGLYLIVMAWLTFRYHTIGGMGVETDFYVELVPQAKKLLAGEFSPIYYGAKGPVYSIMLAGVFLIVRDFFTAGLLINLLSGAIFLVAVYHLISTVFNRLAGIIVTIAIMANALFLSYTYQAASDLPFMALCAISMLFLMKGKGKTGLIFSAIFAAAAFLTRYNGAFVAAGSMLFLAIDTGDRKERLKRVALWLLVFVVAGLPWYVPNAVVMGSPVHNNNYMNVMLEYYGNVSDTGSYENWTDALPEQFESIGDIVLHDPVYFFIHSAQNIYRHFYSDMRELLDWRLGFFVVAGIALLFFAGLDRRKVAFFSFGAFYFAILTLVFYNARFSMFLLVFYLPLAIWPFVADRPAAWLKHIALPGTAVVAFLTVILLYSSLTIVVADMKRQPLYLLSLKELGLALDKIEADKSQKLLARKPHVAYFSGLEATMFPPDVHSLRELASYLDKHNIEYVLYSGIEASYRPDFRELLQVDQQHYGLRYVAHNQFGVIYRRD